MKKHHGPYPSNLSPGLIRMMRREEDCDCAESRKWRWLALAALSVAIVEMVLLWVRG